LLHCRKAHTPPIPRASRQGHRKGTVTTPFGIGPAEHSIRNCIIHTCHSELFHSDIPFRNHLTKLGLIGKPSQSLGVFRVTMIQIFVWVFLRCPTILIGRFIMGLLGDSSESHLLDRKIHPKFVMGLFGVPPFRSGDSFGIC
jgi:hypothetical protein